MNAFSPKNEVYGSRLYSCIIAPPKKIGKFNNFLRFRALCGKNFESYGFYKDS